MEAQMIGETYSIRRASPAAKELVRVNSGMCRPVGS